MAWPSSARLRQLGAQGEDAADVEGTFAIHGTSHRLHLTVETTLVQDKSGEAIQFQTAFPVSLADYGIPRPEFLILKLADSQKVRVRGVATSRAHEALAGH
jgi:polyisoprenoid-binding protein YceI